MSGLRCFIYILVVVIYGIEIVFVFFLGDCRSVALHQRAQCFHSAVGQFAHRAVAKLQLGRRLQVTGHDPSPHVLWK